MRGRPRRKDHQRAGGQESRRAAVTLAAVLSLVVVLGLIGLGVEDHLRPTSLAIGGTSSARGEALAERRLRRLLALRRPPARPRRRGRAPGPQARRRPAPRAGDHGDLALGRRARRPQAALASCRDARRPPAPTPSSSSTSTARLRTRCARPSPTLKTSSRPRSILPSRRPSPATRPSPAPCSPNRSPPPSAPSCSPRRCSWSSSCWSSARSSLRSSPSPSAR